MKCIDYSRLGAVGIPHPSGGESSHMIHRPKADEFVSVGGLPGRLGPFGGQGRSTDGCRKGHLPGGLAGGSGVASVDPAGWRGTTSRPLVGQGKWG